ncbi:S26 family signal peptidase [Haloarcula sp. JP-Z28]|nr:S26 family signal peptidase [Haloarcula sp. JP-Z28]
MWARVERVVEVLIIVFAITLLAGQVVGQPLLLAYVETGSMEPALDPGDGFLTLPPEVVGEPAPGDVIIYRAEQVNGGDLTTHRIVRETERGYITQGDANPFTDQSAGEPPVRDPQVVAVGIRVAGTLITIPELGTAVMAVQTVGGAFQQRVPTQVWVGAGVAGLFLLLASSRDTGGLNRDSVQNRTGGHDSGRGLQAGPREVVLLCGAVVVATATLSVLLPLGPTEYQVVSAETDLPGPGVIPAGETETTAYRVPGGTVFPVKYYVEPASDGVQVLNGTGSGRIQPNNSANATVRLFAPSDTGAYRRYVQEYRYPLILPEPAIEILYQLSPLAPVLVFDTVLALPFIIVARIIGDGPRIEGSPGVSSRWSKLFGGSQR